VGGSDPILNINKTRNMIGSVDLLYEWDGNGGINTLNVHALPKEDENFTHSANLEDRNTNTTKLEIFGNPKQFGLAKRSIIDVIEENNQGSNEQQNST
jgi:hypothetical protein